MHLSPPHIHRHHHRHTHHLLQEYQTALLLDSENPLLLYSLGRAHAGLGMDREAIEVFEKVPAVKNAESEMRLQCKPKSTV